MNRGGAEREGDTESETGSRLWAVSPEPDVELELTDREIMTWAEVGRLTDWTTQAPLDLDFFMRLCYNKESEGNRSRNSQDWEKGAEFKPSKMKDSHLQQRYKQAIQEAQGVVEASPGRQWKQSKGNKVSFFSPFL